VNDPLIELFGNLDRWRHLPTYQLERRADIFFSLYLPAVLSERTGVAVSTDMIPELPICKALLGESATKHSVKVDYAVFASYAPANDPQLVTSIVIERGGHGGVAGALTALDFYSKYFKVKRPNIGTVVDRST